MGVYKVLIAEGSAEISTELARRLSGSCTVRIRQEGELIPALVEDYAPDLLVLDLMLPGADGISVLTALVQGPCRPSVLAVSRHITDYIADALTGLGVDYIMPKPCAIDELAERAKDLLRYRFCTELLPYSEEEAAYAHARRLGVAAHLRGSKYLREALRLMLRNPNQQITKALYPAVGARFHVSAQRVERCIRNAIHLAWEKRNDQIWRQYFPTDANGQIPRPTNSQFIARILERMRFVA